MALTRIMYIEYKGHGLTGEARIGRVNFTKSGKSIHYGGKLFISRKGRGLNQIILMKIRERFTGYLGVEKTELIGFMENDYPSISTKTLERNIGQ
ncbi:hypothetical protein D3C87_167220 [compost metagenome]